MLDIDGVLLSGSAWLLPGNAALSAIVQDLPRGQASAVLGREAAFDPVSVALVHRVCRSTGARLVVASSWRYSVGLEATRSKLLDQGIDEALLHPDWSCPVVVHGERDKARDIGLWVEQHPEVADWLVIDDEPELVPGRTLAVDPLDGLRARDAAAAVRYLGGQDAMLGVGPLPVADLALVEQAFGSRVAAARWLEGADTRTPRRSRPSALLSGSRREEALRALHVATASQEPGDGEAVTQRR